MINNRLRVTLNEFVSPVIFLIKVIFIKSRNDLHLFKDLWIFIFTFIVILVLNSSYSSEKNKELFLIF